MSILTDNRCKICGCFLLPNSIYSYDSYCFNHYPLLLNKEVQEECKIVNEVSCKLGYKDISGENAEKQVLTPLLPRGNSKRNVSKEIQFHTGDIIEQYQYEKPIITGFQDIKKKNKKKSRNKRKQEKSKEAILDKRLTRRLDIIEGRVNLDNIRRSRSRKKKEIRRLVNSNCIKENKKYCSFFTCTYKDNFQDEFKAREDFNKFIKRLQYNYPGEEKEGKWLDFTQYIWAIERQKRGAIHFHVIFFNCPFLHWKDYTRVWGKGSIDVHELKKARNAGSYVCKYFTDYDESFLENPILGKSWCRSLNLKNADIKRFFDYQSSIPGFKFFRSYGYETEINGFCRMNIYLRC